MMKLLERATVVIFLLVLAAFVALNIHLRRNVDRVPPVITCDSDVIELSIGASEEELLRGVTATDNRDGDVTDRIVIKGISQLITADTAKVTYIAFDSSNNMSTVGRTVRYTDYEKPRFALDRPMRFRMGEQVRLLSLLTASDVLDGNLSDNIRVTSQNVDITLAGVYSVTVQVTNSLGDVESVPLKISVLDEDVSAPAVRLCEYITYLEAGERFDPAAYITKPSASGVVEVSEQPDTDRPGAYIVSYTYQNDTVYQTVVVR